MLTGMAIGFALLLQAGTCVAAGDEPLFHEGRVNFRGLIQAGGVIGYVTIAISVAMVAIMIEHLLSIRRDSIMPRKQAEELFRLISAGQLSQAETLCQKDPTFLSYVVRCGLQASDFGYQAIEKAMEDAAVEQSARLSRKIEYLAVIGAVGPMMGLLGTVWGMIQAFAEFAEKTNPMPSDFAPAISEALVTTMFGLCVAIPALAAYAWFRNRIDEFVAQGTIMASHVVSPLRGRERRTGNSVTAPVREGRPG